MCIRDRQHTVPASSYTFEEKRRAAMMRPASALSFSDIAARSAVIIFLMSLFVSIFFSEIDHTSVLFFNVDIIELTS